MNTSTATAALRLGALAGLLAANYAPPATANNHCDLCHFYYGYGQCIWHYGGPNSAPPYPWTIGMVIGCTPAEAGCGGEPCY